MWTNDYIRVPFVDRGRDRSGVDCWGLIVLIYAEQLGLNLPSLDDYENVKDKTAIAEIIDQTRTSYSWQPVSLGEEKMFDVLVFQMNGVPMHVGVVAGGGEMIHCQKGCGTHISNYVKSQEWSRRLVGIYRYAKNTESPTSVSSDA